MTKLDLLCIVCDEGTLEPEVYSDSFSHAGMQLTVEGLERCRCASCGADPVLPDQARRNQLRIADAKRIADGRLSGEQVRGIREALSLSQAEASELFGGGPNAFSKYERGDVLQSVAMDRLLKIVAAHPALLQFLRVEVGDVVAPTSNIEFIYVRPRVRVTDWMAVPQEENDRASRFVRASITPRLPKWTYVQSAIGQGAANSDEVEAA